MDPTVLPVKLQPANVRPLAYRVLLKKYGLNVQTDALKVLTDTLGLRFGSDWKGAKLHQFLESIAKLWKIQDRGLFVDGQGLTQVLSEMSNTGSIKKNGTNLSSTRNTSLDQFASNGDQRSLDLNSNTTGRSLVSGSGDIELENSIKDHSDEAPTAGRSDTIIDVDSNDINTMNIDDPTNGVDSSDQSNTIHWQDYFKIINGDTQPKYLFDRTRKQFMLIKNGNPNSMTQKVEYYANRYNLVNDRLLRNENFQKPLISSFHLMAMNTNLASNGGSTSSSSSYQITLIKNLLGRNGNRFILFGLLAQNENGDYCLEDKTDRIALDISQAYKNEGSYYCTGMFVVVEGIYSASGGSDSAAVGSGIGGCFHVSNMGQPAAERRDTSLSVYGELDFMGLQEKNEGKLTTENNHIMRINRQLRKKFQAIEKQYTHKMIFLGVDCFLDNEKTLLGLKRLFERLENEILNGEDILSIVFSGSFTLTPLTATSTAPTSTPSSAEYKNLFDSLAALLSNHPTLVNNCKFVFVPGSNDPWQSTFSLGSTSSQIWPQKGIPSLFISRLARIIPKENLIAAWNPTRINYLLQEIAIMRDDLTLKLKRNDIIFPSEVEEERAIEKEELNNPHLQQDSHVSTKVKRARQLVKTILDQGFMQPFKDDLKTVKPYYDYVLRLEPLPLVLILNDSTIGRFEVTYNGCKVINTGLLMGSSRVLNYAEYMPSTKKFSFKEVHF